MTTVINKNSKNIQDKMNGITSSLMWSALFIGGMTGMMTLLMIIGVRLDWDFVIDGIYAMNNFYRSIGTASFAELAKELADNCAVFIHTSMCIGYIPVILAMFLRRKEKGGYGKLIAMEIPDMFKWLAISMAASFVLDLIMSALCNIPYFAKQAADLASVGVLSTAGLPWLALLTTGILAPIVEEIAFRRGIQKNMTDKFNPVVGILTASIVFGVMHGNLFQGVFAALMGVILGYVYYKTDNLWYTTIIHIVNNSACVLISILGLNSIVVGITIPVVCGLAYVISERYLEHQRVKRVVSYIQSVYATNKTNNH